ncbi:unnamed protein product [Urochloa decumbens]|uniref:Uncharacterized protein n=1 Tax=Urochloa decumbens TaxID=240449 RepID=A0ABC9B8L1_9POAL
MQRRGEFSFPGSPARGLLPPRPPPSLTAAPRHGEEDEEVRWLQASRQASPDYSSGTPSPQLWAYHNPHHQQLHRPYPASAGSSPSRAQAIAGYRREMLDLVRGLPESAYELSLRDIVDHPAAAAAASSSSPPPPTPPPPPQPSIAAAEAAKNDEPDATAAAVEAEAQVEEGKKQSGSGGKKQGRKQRGMMRKQRSRSLERSVSLDTGLLIKLFLPLSMGGKKKVSPRPDAAKDGKKKKKDKEKKNKKQGKQPEAVAKEKEEEWWSKSEFSEAGGSSRTSSTGSSSTSSGGSVRNGHVNGGVNPRAPARSWSRKRTGCYAFFRANKSKNGVGQD